MLFLSYIPKQPLAGFVELFWYCEGNVPKYAKEHRLPTGSLELVVNLREDTFRVYDREEANQFRSVRGSLICGPQGTHTVLDTACQESLIGVHFKPGGVFAFLGLPPGELCNAHVSLEDLWGGAANQLRLRLLEARTPQARFCLLEEFLLRRANRPLVHHPAVRFALQQFQNDPSMTTVCEVVRQTGYSHRRFIQVFRDEVGLAPKLFCRILRFQEVLRRIENSQNLDWPNIALACGYFDQAHLLRDFRAFSGLRPTTYLRQRSEHRNHVPLID